MNRLTQIMIDLAIKAFSPLLLLGYNPSWHRKHIIKIILITTLTPIIGIFRGRYVRHQFRKQLQIQTQQKQIQLKESFEKIDFNINSVDADYIIAIKSNPLKYDEEMLYDRQKVLYELNNQILDKSKGDQTYFDGIKFIFIGNKNIFDVLPNTQNGGSQSLAIEYLQKKSEQPSAMSPKQNQDTIYLISKQLDGSQKILLQLEYEAKLQAILRQISKHKHKKYLKSMNF